MVNVRRGLTLLLGGLLIAAIFSLFSVDNIFAQSTSLNPPKNVKSVRQSESSIKLTWGKVDGAKGYYIYRAKAGSKKYKKIKTIKKASTTKYINKKLTKNKTYKYKVKAYSGKAKSKYSEITKAKVYSSKAKYVNVSSVKINKQSLSLNYKDSTILKATAVVKKGKKPISKTIKWRSSNTSVATVSKNGEVTAKGLGSCYVYATAHNGINKKILVTVAPNPKDFDTTYQQEKINYTTVNGNISNFSYINSEMGIDNVVVTAGMTYKGTTTTIKTKAFTMWDIIDNNGNFDIKLDNYGKYWFKAAFYSQGELIYTSPAKTVGVVAEEYNFSFQHASFSVVYASFNIWDVKENSNGEPVPTFCLLDRPWQYDWDKLPKNVYYSPYITEYQAKNSTSQQYLIENQMSDYIRDLYSLNKDSKFNLYITDENVDWILHLLTKNRIPEDQSSVTLISEGNTSYGYFNQAFGAGNSDPQQTYDKMVADWNRAKEYTYNNQKVIDFTGFQGNYGNVTCTLRHYPCVVANEENADWWLPRNDSFFADEEFEKLALKNVTLKDINAMLTALKNKGTSTVSEFKALFKFNDSFFKAAEDQGKDVMLILGQRVTNETDFVDYAKFVMEFYGDDYVYYYKGHPGTPTPLYPEKQQDLDNLGITDIESTIPAELILFFYPDLYVSGYNSSVFSSVPSEMACGMFVYNIGNSAGVGAYNEVPDFYISKVTSGTYYDKARTFIDGEYDKCYLVEYLNNADYDGAIWDAENETITYFTEEEGVYTQI